MIEIKDFAGALRQMADNADRLADRHDVAEIAALRRQGDEQAAKARRDADLIAELRRQVSGAWRSLDAIGRMRGNERPGAVGGRVVSAVDPTPRAPRVDAQSLSGVPAGTDQPATVQAVSGDVRAEIARLLVERFAPDHLDDEYRAEMARLNMPVPDPVDSSTMVSFVASDGMRSMRPLRFGEIADAFVAAGFRRVAEDPKPMFPQPNAWRIEVTIPLALPDEQRHALLDAIADAVDDWEPEDRVGWDSFVSGHAVYDEFVGEVGAALRGGEQQ